MYIYFFFIKQIDPSGVGDIPAEDRHAAPGHQEGGETAEGAGAEGGGLAQRGRQGEEDEGEGGEGARHGQGREPDYRGM